MIEMDERDKTPEEMANDAIIEGKEYISRMRLRIPGMDHTELFETASALSEYRLPQARDWIVGTVFSDQLHTIYGTIGKLYMHDETIRNLRKKVNEVLEVDKISEDEFREYEKTVGYVVSLAGAIDVLEKELMKKGHEIKKSENYPESMDEFIGLSEKTPKEIIKSVIAVFETTEYVLTTRDAYESGLEDELRIGLNKIFDRALDEYEDTAFYNGLVENFRKKDRKPHSKDAHDIVEFEQDDE